MSSTYIGLKAILAPGIAATTAVVTEGAAALQKMQAAEAPIKDGTLAAGIHIKSIEVGGTSVVATIATGAESSEYAVPQHEGSAPHVIRARNARALSWPGAAHPVKQVNHPGNPPTKFMENPLIAFAPDFLAKYAALARAAY